MEEKLVSIIIPAYNVSEYISRGIESCVSQTYGKIEIIIVDDGSTDHTWDIISDWQKSDSRIKAVRQENCGVSVSRNVGLEYARGEYVLFLDGDDWLEQDAVEYLIRIKGVREDVIASCSYYNVQFDKGELKKYCNQKEHPPVFVSSDAALKCLLNGMYGLLSACYKLYPVCIIKNLRFAPDIYNMEDGLFSFQAISQSVRIVYGTEPKWNILFRTGSFTRSGYNEKQLTAITAIEKMMDYNKNVTIWPLLVRLIFLRALQLLNDALLEPDRNKDDIIFLKEKMKRYINCGHIYVKKFTTLLNAILVFCLPVRVASGYRKMIMFLRNVKGGGNIT